MFSLLYNGAILLFALCFLPKLLWQRMRHGKYKESLGARLGLKMPQFFPREGELVFWIHAISMGETRAVIPLYRLMRQTYPNAAILISSTTETGHAEAKRSMPDARAHFFLPLDLSWIMRRLIKRLRPHALILCESDFWYHLIAIAKEQHAHVCLINGKVSERSCSRFQKIPFFTRRLFQNIDYFCLQSERHLQRFSLLGIPSEKLLVTGNIKLDVVPKKMTAEEKEQFCQTLGITTGDRILVIGSTHDPEEEWLLAMLDTLWKKIPRLKVLLVPRHPERFGDVAQKIAQKGISYGQFSQKSCKEKPLILIDAMGLLNQCYQLADVAIVGGSYVAHVGGHNVFEPVLFGVPVLFGPHMHSQLDLQELVINGKAGLQVSLEELPDAILSLLENPEKHAAMRTHCLSLAQSVPGATQRTFGAIQQFLSSTRLCTIL
ncbi:MAG: 3-deoxy-D-manno-octulosonic acid transferase [Chlamydiota bacterium]